MPRDVQPSSSESRSDVIPEDATNLTATCVWCTWSRPIRFGESAGHTCYGLEGPYGIRRQPAVRIEYRIYRPFTGAEHSGGVILADNEIGAATRQRPAPGHRELRSR